MAGASPRSPDSGTSSVATSGTKLTYDDLLLFPDDGKRHELIDGEHYVTASPNLRHQEILGNLFREVGAFVREHRLGKLYFAPLDVVLSRHDVVEPDLLFVAGDRLEVLTEANLQGPPSLAVEVLSGSTRRRDETLKRDLFERRGVDEYWLVDPAAETVKVYRREGERFGRPQLLSRREGDRLDTPLLPGLALALDAVFED